MKKIKDFIYDKNDIIIALLILVVAALIIGWRLDVILEYPKLLLNSGEVQIENENSSDKADSSKNDEGKGSDSDSNQSNSDNNSSNDDNDASSGSAELPLWQGGATTKDVEVNVTGSSASAAIQCLVDAGLFKDYKEYQTICSENGLDHEKVKGGTFTFKKGSTKLSVAKEMNWG